MLLLGFLVVPGPALGADFALTSPAFAEGKTIPRSHTCEGQDASPPLAWTGAPVGAKGLALTVTDPDAPGGTFDHWVLYDLPAVTAKMDPDAPRPPALSSGAKQGRNGFGTVGYRGPCPPPGRPHRYVFTLYALDVPSLKVSPGATSAQVEQAMAGHVLEKATLTGLFGR